MKASFALVGVLGVSLFLLGCVQPGPGPKPTLVATPTLAATPTAIATVQAAAPPEVSQALSDADVLAAQSDTDLSGIDQSVADAGAAPTSPASADADVLPDVVA